MIHFWSASITLRRESEYHKTERPNTERGFSLEGGNEREGKKKASRRIIL